MIENFLELIDIEEIELLDTYENMVDISIDIDQSFSLSNGIISHNSAAGTVLTGFASTGRDYYGCFPLKGKPLNVRDTAVSKIKENDEIKNIISALGLEFGKKYTSTRELRYGKVVIMTDADCICGETKVRTKRGDIEIKNLTYDDLVLTHNGEYKQIKNIIQTQKDKYVEIEVNGKLLKFGEYHKVIIVRDGEISEVFAKDVLKTDLMLFRKNPT